MTSPSMARLAVLTSPRLAAASVAMVLALALVQGACSKTAPVPVAVLPAPPSDADVTTTVQRLLRGDGQWQGLRIAVHAKQGAVSLTSAMRTQVQIDHALALARATAGARGVQGGLVLAPL